MDYVGKIVVRVVVTFAIMFLFRSPLVGEEKIRIGVSTALSGDAATYGQDVKNFLMFANDRLAGGRYEFVFEDDRCNGKDAVNVAHKLISVDKIKYVTGFACSGALLSAAKLYEEAGVLVVSSCTSAPSISFAGDYIFRTWPSDVQPARRLTKFMAEQHNVIGIISEQTDFAQGFSKASQEYASEIGLKVYAEDFLSSDTDFKAQLLKFRKKQIKGLFINSQTERTFLLVLKQVQEMKLNVPLYGAYWPESKAFLEEAGAAAEGIRYVSSIPSSEALTAQGRQVLDDFYKKYERINSVEMIFAATYEAFSVMHQAIQSGKESREFLNKSRFSGIMGDWEFDKNGDIIGIKFMIGEIKNGRAVKLED